MGAVSGGAVSGPEKTPSRDGGAARLHSRILWFAALCGALLISRWALFPRYLITFDEINFALAVHEFNPRLSQPQPPGYPLFVALLKLLSFFTSNMEATFLLAGLLVSAVALAALWRLCDLMAGPELGIFGALLLLFNPAFWLSALTNPVRLCFAAGAAVVGLCVWEACARKSAAWLALGAAALGVAAGARPALPLLMAPLLLWAAGRIRMRWKAAAVTLLCFGAAVATWLPALIAASGGGREFVVMLRGYSQNQMSGTSLLFGAAIGNALQMASKAVAWSCLGALSWAWAVPIVLWLRRTAFDPFTARFLALWFFPGLLFYAAFHVADPDHTLAIVPATCAAGLLAVAALTKNAPRTKRRAVLSICVLLNVFLFFKPITKTTKPSTYPPVRWMTDYVTGVIEGIRNLKGHGPVTAIFAEINTGWRQLSYYDPSAHIVLLMANNRIREISGSDVTETSVKGAIPLPSCGVLAWIDPQGPPAANRGTVMQSTRWHVFFTRAARGESFAYRGFRFATGGAACGAAP